MSSIIQQIDESLQNYYDSFENLQAINRYTNSDNIGKFALFCSENGIDDEDIESELEYGPAECSLIDFDIDEYNNHKFPFNKPLSNKQNQSQEIYRIIKNMFIDAKTPQSQPKINNYIFSGQRFYYNTNESKIQKLDDVSFLIYGYIRLNENEFQLNEYVGGVPNVLIQIMIFFYGKKYFLNCAPPNSDEYDYAMEILAPIDCIGISFRNCKIADLHSEMARQNIIHGSTIIQINDKSVPKQIDKKSMDAMLSVAKKMTPSFIVFRCKKDTKVKGTHLQFDISYKQSYITDSPKKFPYYRFTKNVITNIFESVFGVHGEIEIMEIYANKHCNNGFGSYGVSILVFVHNSEKLFKNYELFDSVPMIQQLLRHKINDNLEVRFTKKMEGIKSNGMNCGWGRTKRSLYELCFLVQEHDRDNAEEVFYFVMVDIDRMDLFHIQQNRNIFNITSQGHILYSSYVFPPGLRVQKKLLSSYKFAHNTDDTFDI